MKKFLSVLLAAGLLATTAGAASSAPASADAERLSQWERADAAHEVEVAAAEHWAYRDMEDATSAEQARILEARETMIYNQSWVADGFEGTITSEDGTVTRVPHFSELFPESWEIPEVAGADTDASAGKVELGAHGADNNADGDG